MNKMLKLYFLILLIILPTTTTYSNDSLFETLSGKYYVDFGANDSGTSFASFLIRSNGEFQVLFSNPAQSVHEISGSIMGSTNDINLNGLPVLHLVFSIGSDEDTYDIHLILTVTHDQDDKNIEILSTFSTYNDGPNEYSHTSKINGLTLKKYNTSTKTYDQIK